MAHYTFNYAKFIQTILLMNSPSLLHVVCVHSISCFLRLCHQLCPEIYSVYTLGLHVDLRIVHQYMIEIIHIIMFRITMGINI